MIVKLYSRFPQGADKLVQFFDWELDELIFPAFFIVIGLALKNPLIMLFSFFSMKLYMKGKQRFPNNFIFIFLYSMGLIKEKTSVPGYVRTFME